jgi:hypothetical protein
MTMFDERTNLSNQVMQDLKAFLWQPVVRDCGASEHPSWGSPKSRKAHYSV